MTKLPRTLRLDASDAVIFDRAAAPGEWAVPGGFHFWDDALETLAGKRRQAFRSGFLGLATFGWSTLVEIAEATPVERDTALAALAMHIRDAFGAPDEAAARAAAEEELAFAESLCEHPPGTVLAVARSLEDGAMRERFRTLHRRPADRNTLPVFNIIAVDDAEDAPLHPDLTRLAQERP